MIETLPQEAPGALRTEQVPRLEKSYGDLELSSKPSSYPPSAERIPSITSCFGGEHNSAGGETIMYAKEKASDMFANILAVHLQGRLWPDGIELPWVRGRNAIPRLNWNVTYSLAHFVGLILGQELFSNSETVASKHSPTEACTSKSRIQTLCRP